MSLLAEQAMVLAAEMDPHPELNWFCAVVSNFAQAWKQCPSADEVEALEAALQKLWRLEGGWGYFCEAMESLAVNARLIVRGDLTDDAVPTLVLSRHPEAHHDEIYIANVRIGDAFNEGYETARLGHVAYDFSDESDAATPVLEDYRPVFVKGKEASERNRRPNDSYETWGARVSRMDKVIRMPPHGWIICYWSEDNQDTITREYRSWAALTCHFGEVQPNLSDLIDWHEIEDGDKVFWVQDLEGNFVYESAKPPERGIPCEVFILAVNPSDGTLPDIVTGQIYGSADAALEAKKQQPQGIRNDIGVYRALITLSSRVD
jgi:hypothetical protein